MMQEKLSVKNQVSRKHVNLLLGQNVSIIIFHIFIMPTISQLVKKPRKDKITKSKSPALQVIRNSLKRGKLTEVASGNPFKR